MNSHINGDEGKAADEKMRMASLSIPSVSVQAGREELVDTFIRLRESQRKYWQGRAFVFALGIVAILYFAMLGFICAAFWFVYQLEPSKGLEALKSLGSLWHIVLILALPPTTILGILLRNVSLHSNASEFARQQEESKKEGDIAIIEFIKVLIDAVKSAANK